MERINCVPSPWTKRERVVLLVKNIILQIKKDACL